MADETSLLTSDGTLILLATASFTTVRSVKEVLQKRLENIDRNWLRYAKVGLIFHLLLLVFLLTVIVTVRFAFLIF